MNKGHQGKILWWSEFKECLNAKLRVTLKMYVINLIIEMIQSPDEDISSVQYYTITLA